MNRAEVQASIEKRDKISGLNLGQRIVVKAWMDPEFKVREIVDLEIYSTICIARTAGINY